MMLLLGLMLASCCGPAWSSRILALVPIASRSHSILMDELVLELDARGHQVTYVSPFPPRSPLSNGTLIHISDLNTVMAKSLTQKSDTNLLMTLKDRSPWLNQLLLPDIGYSVCRHVLAHPHIQRLIHSTEKFDLILGTIILDESLLAGFANKFNAPLVALSTLQAGVWANFMTGNPAPASYVPDPFLGFDTKMTFWERFTNTFFIKMIELHYENVVLPTHDALMREHFGSDLPSIESILRNASLVLINHHHSMGYPRPYGPSMIEIGGFHVGKPQPLPEDVQAYMDEAKHGVILFSLGSNAQSSHMPPATITAFLNAFTKLKQNVLWKFETDLPNLPKNVKIMAWLPQADVLAHPNIKLFMTHGGMLSTAEAVDRGVPIVGIPLFADQHANMRHMDNAGLGKTITFDHITDQLIVDVVTEVISNPRYKEAAMERSSLLKDTPMPGLEKAVWWLEYVLRHKGAPHLRLQALTLAWYQLYLIDVYIVAFILLLASSSATYLSIKYIFSCVFKRTANHQLMLKKNK